MSLRDNFVLHLIDNGDNPRSFHGTHSEILWGGIGGCVNHIDQIIRPICTLGVFDERYGGMFCLKGWLDTMLLAIFGQLIKLVDSLLLHFFMKKHIYPTALFLSAGAKSGTLVTHFVHKIADESRLAHTMRSYDDHSLCSFLHCA